MLLVSDVTIYSIHNKTCTLPWQPEHPCATTETKSTALQKSTNECQIMLPEQFVSQFPSTYSSSLIIMEHYLLLFSVTHLYLIFIFFREAEND